MRKRLNAISSVNLLTQLLSSVIMVASLAGCRSSGTVLQTENNKEIRGIYGSPVPLWEKGLNLDELNVNAVFMNWHSLDKTIFDRIQSDGIKVFAEFPLLNGKGYVENHPEAWAVDNHGEKVEYASWFMGVCPTDKGFRDFRIKELKELLSEYDLDGVWLDYLHWHAQFEEPEPILPETCFCDNCLRTFEEMTGISVDGKSTSERSERILEQHDAAWRAWRCEIIAGWVKEMRRIVKETNPDALLGIYHCPWDDVEFDSARIRILGLDYDLLRDITDVFSPMVYHGRMGRKPEWVKENTEWFCSRLKIEAGIYPKVWPIVQAYNDPYIMEADEFEYVLRSGAGSEASGVMMFTTRAVADDTLKTERMAGVYSGWIN